MTLFAATFRAPAGCTQYFTGLSGSFKSYNHANGQILAAQSYKHCFRQEKGNKNIFCLFTKFRERKKVFLPKSSQNDFPMRVATNFPGNFAFSGLSFRFSVTQMVSNLDNFAVFFRDGKLKRNKKHSFSILFEKEMQ